MLHLLSLLWELWCAFVIIVGGLVIIGLAYCGPFLIIYLLWRFLK